MPEKPEVNTPEGKEPEAKGAEPQGGAEPKGGTEAPEVDLEAIRAEVRKEIEAKVAARLKELVGVESLEDLERKILEEEGRWQDLAERAKREAEQWRTRYQETLKRSEITALAARLGAVDPEVVLALVAPKAEVTDDGRVLIDGKPAEEAIKGLLSEKPYLAKASESAGSGTPAGQPNETEALKKQLEEAIKRGDTIEVLRIKAELARKGVQ